MKLNGVVCQPGPSLLFFIFRFEYLISGVTGTFEKRAPGVISVLVKLSRIGRNRAPYCFPYAVTVPLNC